MNKETKKNEKLTVLDLVLAFFYIVIIITGVVMCINHGLGGSFAHMVSISICVWGVMTVKVIKYRKSLKKHLGELIFVGLMCVISIITIIGTLA